MTNTTLTNSLTALTETVDSKASVASVNDLTGKVANMEASVTNLTDRLGDCSCQNITDLMTDVEALRADLTSTNNELDQLQAAVDQLLDPYSEDSNIFHAFFNRVNLLQNST
jgi:hypothetical protein